MVARRIAMHGRPEYPRFSDCSGNSPCRMLVTVAGVITVEVILFALLGGMALWSGFSAFRPPDIQKHALEARPLLEPAINRSCRLRANPRGRAGHRARRGSHFA